MASTDESEREERESGDEEREGKESGEEESEDSEPEQERRRTRKRKEERKSRKRKAAEMTGGGKDEVEGGRAAAWHDEEDEVEGAETSLPLVYIFSFSDFISHLLQWDISTPMLRKLKAREDEKDVTSSVYSSRLRAQYMRLSSADVSWATGSLLSHFLLHRPPVCLFLFRFSLSSLFQQKRRKKMRKRKRKMTSSYAPPPPSVPLSSLLAFSATHIITYTPSNSIPFSLSHSRTLHSYHILSSYPSFVPF